MKRDDESITGAVSRLIAESLHVRAAVGNCCIDAPPGAATLHSDSCPTAKARDSKAATLRLGLVQAVIGSVRPGTLVITRAARAASTAPSGGAAPRKWGSAAEPGRQNVISSTRATHCSLLSTLPATYVTEIVSTKCTWSSTLTIVLTIGQKADFRSAKWPMGASSFWPMAGRISGVRVAARRLPCGTYSKCTRPRLSAVVTACVRSLTPSLRKMWAMWVFTVLALRNKAALISLLLFPATNRRSTARSR